jgi:hypothetical protein
MKCHSGPAFAESASWRSRQACAGIPLGIMRIGIADHVRDENQTFESASFFFKT